MFQITASKFDELDAALIKAQQILELKAALEKEEREARDTLLALINELGLDNKVVPGLSMSIRTSVQIDENAVLSYALDDLNFPHAAPLLKVRKDAIGVVIAAAMQDDRLKGVFELDKAGAERAAREGTHVDLPHGEPVETAIVNLKPDHFVTGAALAAKFVIVPDEMPAIEEAV